MARIDRDRALRAQIFSRNALDNFLFQTGKPSSVTHEIRNASQSSNRHVPADRSCSKARSSGCSQPGRESRPASARCDRRCAKADRRAREIFPCARFPRARSISRGAQTRRIDQANRNAAQIDHLFDRVACCAGKIADDRAVVTKQTIEQTRFAGVGRAVNDHAHAFAQDASLVRGREQVRNFFLHRIETRAQFVAFIRCDSFIRKIDRRFTLASSSTASSRITRIFSPSRPSSCSVAERSARSVCARIRSMTASACVRSILPL